MVGNYSCTWVFSGTVTGSVNVPTGEICSLDHATVTGNVTVQPGAGLLIIHGSTIGGSVTSNSARDFQPDNDFFNSAYPSFRGSIYVCGSRVKGAVNATNAVNQVTVGAPSAGRLNDPYNRCPGSTVDGAVTTAGVQGGVEVVNSSVGGKVQITNTSGCPNDEYGCNDGNFPPAASVEVTGNTIVGSLTCSNSQYGVDVHDNTVRGSTSCT